MLHKVYLKKHAVIEVEGEQKSYSGGEHLVEPDIARKLTTQSAGGVLVEKHNLATGEVETIKPSAVESLIEGEVPTPPKASAKKPAAKKLPPPAPTPPKAPADVPEFVSRETGPPEADSISAPTDS